MSTQDYAVEWVDDLPEDIKEKERWNALTQNLGKLKVGGQWLLVTVKEEDVRRVGQAVQRFMNADNTKARGVRIATRSAGKQEDGLHRVYVGALKYDDGE